MKLRAHRGRCSNDDVVESSEAWRERMLKRAVLTPVTIAVVFVASDMFMPTMQYAVDGGVKSATEQQP